MVYCVQSQMGFRNAARRDTISQNIQTRLAQTTPWGEVVRQDITTESGDPGVILEVRFNTRAEQEAFWNDAITFVGTGINGPVSGSFMQRHDCPHDEQNPAPCVVALKHDF